MTIKVSVIIPCFNDGQYVKEAIRSVDLKSNVDTEIVIIDDGSEDPKTKRVLEEVACERVRVLRGEHGGPSAARNMGIEHAEGEYILPLDADDKIEARYIGEALRRLEEDEQIGAVYCHADLFGMDTGKWKLADYSLENMLVDNVVFVTAMFRKSDWSAIGGFKADMQCGMEDYDFFLSILEMGKDIVQLPETYFHYRIRRNSRSVRFAQKMEDIREAYRRIYERHTTLYAKYQEQYIAALQDEVIRLRYERQRILHASGALRIIRRIPPVRWLGCKILNLQTGSRR